MTPDITIHHFNGFTHRRRERYPTTQLGILWVKAGHIAFRDHHEEKHMIKANQFCFYNSHKLLRLESDSSLQALAIILPSHIVERLYIMLSNNDLKITTGISSPVMNCDAFFHAQMGQIIEGLESGLVAKSTLMLVAMSVLSHLYQQRPETLDYIKHSLELTVSQRVIHYIESNIDDSISLDQAANYIGTSVATLKRKLAAENMSFSNLVKIKRLNYATTQLRLTDNSITQIAYDAGYKSAAHFSTSFKSMHDITPKEFRAKLRAQKNRLARKDKQENMDSTNG